MELSTNDKNIEETVRFWVAMGFDVEWRAEYQALWQASIVHNGNFAGLTVPNCYYRIKPKEPVP